MKKIFLLAVVCAMTLSAAAQSFSVYKKSGEVVNYSNEEVDSIVFKEESLPVVENPHIGDIYYSDGTWSTTLKEGATPIGVVFYVGEATSYNDHATYYTQKDGTTPLGELHGYVVALKDATDDGNYNESVWWSAFDSSFEGTGASTNTDDFLGYTNTQSIVETALRDKGELTDGYDNYPAAYYATTVQESKYPAPAQSSGWFMPSAGQFDYIYNRVYFDEDNSGRSCVENTLKALGEGVATPMYCSDSEYWTSTEKVDSYGSATWAYYYNFDSSAIDPGFIADYRKNAGMHVRSILVF